MLAVLHEIAVSKKANVMASYDILIPSKIRGFRNDNSNLSEELYQLYDALREGDNLEDAEQELSSFKERLKTAGIDGVMEEINRQLQNWYDSR